jgi:hypothetical protein
MPSRQGAFLQADDAGSYGLEGRVASVWAQPGDKGSVAVKVGQEGLGKIFYRMREFSDSDKRRSTVAKIYQ